MTQSTGSATGRDPGFPRVTVPSRAAVVATAGAVVVATLAYMVGEALAVFVIGLVLAYILDMPVSWLARHGVPRALGSVLAIAALAVAALAFAAILVGAILEQGAAFLAQVPGIVDRFTEWYTTTELTGPFKAVLDGLVDGISDWAVEFDIAGFVLGIVESLFGLLGSAFTLLALPFFLFFVLKDRPALRDAAFGAFPDPWRPDARALAARVVDNFGNYVRAEAILATVVGVITWAGLMLLSIVVDPRFAEFALFLAVVAAFCELIPTFGPILALIPALMFALTLGPAALVATLILYLVIMFVEGQVLVPWIEGKQFEIHPAWVLVLVLAGLALIGPLGAILALPLAAAGRDVFAYAFRRARGMTPAEAEAVDGRSSTATGGPTTDRPGPAGTPVADASGGAPAR